MRGSYNSPQKKISTPKIYRIMKSMSKAQLAEAAGVNMRTFQRWLSRHKDELSVLGVSSRDKLLPPVAVKYIAEQYGIDL